MQDIFRKAFEGRTVLVTGHTGFKGSWLSLWLHALGARVVGYSLAPPTEPNHFTLCKLAEKMVHIEGDIRNKAHLLTVFEEHQPEIVFHLAAQALVLRSFQNPQETFETNALGTVNVLEAIHLTPTVKAAVMVTSDKCYENHEWLWGYRENDTLGGKDPYSASKAMAELAIRSYQESFFKQSSTAIASVRAGNVIGGGDFSEFRLVPDAMKALMKETPIVVRNPFSVRPWIHVLEPLKGYLQVAAKLLTQGSAFSGAWNFGPQESQGIPVQKIIELAIELWGKGSWTAPAMHTPPPPEMGLLRLNWDKAAHLLDWRPDYTWEEAMQATVHWFKDYHAGHEMSHVSLNQIEAYTQASSKKEKTHAI